MEAVSRILAQLLIVGALGAVAWYWLFVLLPPLLRSGVWVGPPAAVVGYLAWRAWKAREARP